MIHSRQFLFLIIVVFSMFVFGCTEEEKLFIFDTYGKDNAYVKISGTITVLESPQYVAVYVQTTDTTYRQASTYAALKYSELDGIYVNISYTNSSRVFVVQAIDLGSGGCDRPTGCDTVVINSSTPSGFIIARNIMQYGGTNGKKIVGSTIQFNKLAMSGYSQIEKNFIAIHEFGHTMGLKDFYEVDAQGYTVMYGYYDPATTTTHQALTEFDIANLGWHYSDNNA